MAEDANASASVEELTHRACAAAREGRWDVVDRCYRERELQLGTAPLSMEERQRLLALDRRVQEQASVAHRVLASVLRDAILHRRRLEGWRRRIGASVVESGTLFLRA